MVFFIIPINFECLWLQYNFKNMQPLRNNVTKTKLPDALYYIFRPFFFFFFATFWVKNEMKWNKIKKNG